MRDLSIRGRKLSAAAIVSAVTVAGATLFVFWQLRPGLMFADTTPTGGDIGPFVWTAAYLRDHLLPSWHLTGWAPDWYGGFPALFFYFPLPMLLIALIDVVLPFGIAFKVVLALGTLALPVAVYAFGRLTRMAFPGPPLLAVATIPFLFDRFQSLTGGNIPSTLRGEFSFSLGLAMSFVFLGVMARGLRTGRHRVLAVFLLFAIGLTHLLPLVFVVVGTIVLSLLAWLSGEGGRRVRYVASVFAVAGLLAAFWVVPFLVRLPYTTHRGDAKSTQYLHFLFPQHLRLVLLIAVAGAVVSVVQRRQTGMFLTAMAVIVAITFVLMSTYPFWNGRILGFWYLCLWLLAATALAELALFVGRWIDAASPSEAPALVAPILVLMLVVLLVGLPLKAIPSWVPVPASHDVSFIRGWTKRSFGGYERQKLYPEQRAVMQAMGRLPCGRALWELQPKALYGSTNTLALLPYWTDGCIGSMEGQHPESSGTTPYISLSNANLSKDFRANMADLPYGELDVARGIQHLRLLGVRYYMAFTPDAKAAARNQADLRLVATAGRWDVFEVANSPVVAALPFEPAVIKNAPTRREEWLALGVHFFVADPFHQEVPLVAGGLPNWPRVGIHQVKNETGEVGGNVEIDVPDRRPVPLAQVSRVRMHEGHISFDVDRVGSPVLVKVSYFPNWRASGAKGPWRATPNYMVVVPTSLHVSLRYGDTWAEWLGYGLSVVGVVALVALILGDRRSKQLRPLEDLPPAVPVHGAPVPGGPENGR